MLASAAFLEVQMCPPPDTLVFQSLSHKAESALTTTFRLDDVIPAYATVLSDRRAVGWKFQVPSITPVPRIVINEIVQNPSSVGDHDGEWFELYNGGVTVQYEYSSFILGNQEDRIALAMGNSVEVDRIEYDGGQEFPNPTGRSMALLHPDMDNSVGSSRVESSVIYGGGIRWENSSPTISQNKITAGIVPSFLGAAIYCRNATPRIERSTISENPGYFTGGIYGVHGSHPGLVNSILWDNSPDEIYFASYGDSNSVTVAYSDVSPGVYFYHISIHSATDHTIDHGTGFHQVRKMIILR